jgi:hypothetical protein
VENAIATTNTAAISQKPVPCRAEPAAGADVVRGAVLTDMRPGCVAAIIMYNEGFC